MKKQPSAYQMLNHLRHHRDLALLYTLTAIVLLALVIGFVSCHQTPNLLSALPDTQRVLLRSVFYLLAIMLFPLSNLLRHVFIRLNQTMPLAIAEPVNNAAKKRYLLTHVISLLLMSGVGIFGFVLFAYGDGFTTLNIFTGLSILGLFLYRPKLDEYTSIVNALTAQRL